MERNLRRTREDDSKIATMMMTMVMMTAIDTTREPTPCVRGGEMPRTRTVAARRSVLVSHTPLALTVLFYPYFYNTKV